MITQTLKRWWHKLFAWWPWKRPESVEPAQTISNASIRATQEITWQTTIDGTAPQPGNSSIAVEHCQNATSETHRDPISPSSQARQETFPPFQHAANREIDDYPLGEAVPHEQHLIFLQYLVKHSIFNEGFQEGQIPEQYKQAHQ